MTSVIGHQGAPEVAPGNTVAAFRAAAELGADGVELDVRRTADGTLAVFHDARLPDGRPLAELTAADLPDTLCDLDAALAATAGLGVVNVEIKNWPGDSDFDSSLALAERVADRLLARPADERDRFIVSSFHMPTIDRVHEVASELATAWLTVGFATVAQDMMTIAVAGHRAVHPLHTSVDADVVKVAHDAGLAVNVWTCDDPDRIRWLAELGVDGIVTNVPDVALAALGRG